MKLLVHCTSQKQKHSYTNVNADEKALTLKLNKQKKYYQGMYQDCISCKQERVVTDVIRMLYVLTQHTLKIKVWSVWEEILHLDLSWLARTTL